MDWQVRWTRDQKARSIAEGKTLFAVGCDGKSGRNEMTGLMDDRAASFLFLFGHHLYRGLSPEDAFAEARKAVPVPSEVPA